MRHDYSYEKLLLRFCIQSDFVRKKNKKIAAPSSKPAEFTADIEQSDPTTVKLTWQPPEEPNGPITGWLTWTEVFLSSK